MEFCAGVEKRWASPKGIGIAQKMEMDAETGFSFDPGFRLKTGFRIDSGLKLKTGSVLIQD